MSKYTVGEYLANIGLFERTEVSVKTSSLANVMGVSPCSVSEMLQRLSKKGLVDYTPYGGATLTEQGRKRYLKLTRCHRLWEVFLNQYLKIGWEDVFWNARDLGYATSDLMAEKLAQLLGEPQVCPHGSPIPDADGKLPEIHAVPLAQLEVGQTARMVSVVCESDTGRLRYLTSLGLVPGAKVSVLQKAPFDGTITIEVNNSSDAVGTQTASLIMVEPV